MKLISKVSLYCQASVTVALKLSPATTSIIFMNYITGGGGSNRQVLLFLGLLNTVMLIVAVVLGIKCEYTVYEYAISFLISVSHEKAEST